MKVAAFETSGRCVSVALRDTATGHTGEATLESGRERGRRLVTMLEGLLDEAGATVGDIDLFAAGVGPGSYTGIRVGLSLANSMAYASGKPIRGVCSLSVLAAAVEGHSERELVVATNAYRGELFALLLGPRVGSSVRPSLGMFCLSPEDLVTRLKPGHLAAGEGVELYAESFASAGVEVMAGVEPRARDLAGLALEEFRSGSSHDPLTLVPVHLRSTDVEFKKK